MSQPDILMGGSANVRFSKCVKLALGVQRYRWTVKQGEPTDGVQAGSSCKHPVGAISTAKMTRQIEGRQTIGRPQRLVKDELIREWENAFCPSLIL